MRLKPCHQGVLLLIVACGLPLAACATGAGRNAGPSRAAPLQAAVTQPLDDLNLASEDPAAALVRAYQAPVRPPADCPAAARELAVLKTALGPDLLAKPEGTDPAAVAASVVRSVVRLPFRGVVRQLSGAERRARERQAMLYAGMLRQGYLSGWRDARACAPAQTAFHLARPAPPGG